MVHSTSSGSSPKEQAMQIRLGYELAYDCSQPTPMLLMLNVYYTRIVLKNSASEIC
jgi:hypothetical protein